MKELLKNLRLGIVVLDEEGRIEFANDFCLKRGILSKSYEGKKYYEALRSLELIASVGDLIEGKAKERILEHEGRTYRLTPAGKRRFLQIEDITELKMGEKLQREFVATVSHELSTPLTAVKGLLETALTEESPSRDLLRRALKRVEELEKLVKTVRLLITLDREKGKLREEVSLEEAISQVLEDLRAEIEELRLEVIRKIYVDRLTSDREKLYILLRNIVENAVRYNVKGGKIFLLSERTPEGVLLEIRDTGEGIKKEELPFIFNPFFGGENRRGMGLGLAISKKIADFLGVEIEVLSKKGEGTKVSLLFRDQSSNL